MDSQAEHGRSEHQRGRWNETALCPSPLTGQAGWHDDADRLQAMIDDLRRMREQCEPKLNQNLRYLRYSNAVSALRWIIDDLATEDRTA
jgi:hypothetical protein